MRRCSLLVQAFENLDTGNRLAFRCAKTQKVLWTHPPQLFVELNPGFGPPSPTIGEGYIYKRQRRRNYSGHHRGMGWPLFFLLTNPALYEPFSGYVSVPVLP